MAGFTVQQLERLLRTKMLILYSAESNLLSAHWCSILYYVTCSVSGLCRTLFKNTKKFNTSFCSVGPIR